MWYVGLDVHVDTTAVSIRNARGVVVRRAVVPTSRTALREALRLARGRTRVICESGPLAWWVRDALETRLRDVVVCDRRRTRLSASGNKSDRIDADRLAELLHRGRLYLVHVPRGDAALLRRYALHYARMLQDRSRIIQRLRSLYFECAIRVRTHRSTPHRVPLRRLVSPGGKYIASAYLRQLEVSTDLVAEARAELLMLAKRSPAFELLQSIPYVGEIRAAEILAIAGDPQRFRSLRAFWAYGGLGLVQRTSAEHRVESGKIVREERSRGIRLRVGHPLLKRVLRDIALHAAIGRGQFANVFQAHVARGKAPAVARIALARKIAAIILAVWRSGVPYSEAYVRGELKCSG